MCRPENKPTEWLIWSHEHTAWWAPNECGYRTKRAEAGRYSFARAKEIVHKANTCLDIPWEAMVEDKDIYE